MLRIVRGAFALVLLLVAACDNAPTEPPVTPQAIVTTNGPVVFPIFMEIVGPNGCTGETVTYTAVGTGRLIQNGDHSLLTLQGKVETSDGFTGNFMQQEFVIGDRVTHLRYHDIEVSSATGQAFIWSVGFYHFTTVDGQQVVGLEKYGGIGCRGN